MTPPTLSERVLAGDARAIARAISLIEDESPSAAELILTRLRESGEFPAMSRTVGAISELTASTDTSTSALAMQCSRTTAWPRAAAPGQHRQLPSTAR